MCMIRRSRPFPYEPISRKSVVAIALREWRLFGELVDDDPNGTRPRLLPDQKPERVPRV